MKNLILMSLFICIALSACKNDTAPLRSMARLLFLPCGRIPLAAIYKRASRSHSGICGLHRTNAPFFLDSDLHVLHPAPLCLF